MLVPVSWINVLYAHGTINALDELPGFLTEIRRGKPASPELVAEMRHRYERIGHSPLLEYTRQQAHHLQRQTGRETRVAMRLWQPRLSEVVADLDRKHKICLIPMAPFSVDVYRAAAERELSKIPESRRPQLCCVAPWGTQPRLIDAYLSGIMDSLSRLPAQDRQRVPVILTAHSLPSAVIRGGDQYQQQFLATAALVAARLEQPVLTCFQSQGADGGQWLGPDLNECLKRCALGGPGPVVVAPIGFFAEHVETLYDLDVEAKAHAEALDLVLLRVPTVNSDPGLIDALGQAAEQAISSFDA